MMRDCKRYFLFIFGLFTFCFSIYISKATGETVYQGNDFKITTPGNSSSLFSNEEYEFQSMEKLYWNINILKEYSPKISQEIEMGLTDFLQEMAVPNSMLKKEIIATGMVGSISTDVTKKRIVFNLSPYTFVNEKQKIEKARITVMDQENIDYCDLHTNISILNGELTLNLEDFYVSNQVSDINTITTTFGTSSTSLKGILHVYVDCDSFTVDVSPRITITGLHFNFDSIMGINDENNVSITDVTDPTLTLNKVEISTEELNKVKKAITKFGIQYFVDDKCKNNESFEKCIGRQIVNGYGKDKIINKIQTKITEAIPQGINNSIQRTGPQKVNPKFSIDNTFWLKDFQIKPSDPFLQTESSVTSHYKYRSHSCMDGLEEPEDMVTRVRFTEFDPTNYDSEGVLAINKNTILAATYNYLKTGVLCFQVRYKEPTTGMIFSGPLKPNGTIEIDHSSYQAPLYTFDNYEDYFSQFTGVLEGYDPENRFEEENKIFKQNLQERIKSLEEFVIENQNTLPSSDSSTSTDREFEIDRPIELGDASSEPKKPEFNLPINDYDLKLDVKKPEFKAKSTTKKDSKLLGKWDLTISYYSDKAFVLSYPIIFTSTETHNGSDVTLTLNGIIHVYVNLEPNEKNELVFAIKKVEISKFNGDTVIQNDFGNTVVKADDVQDDINLQLAKTFNAYRIEWIEYHSCQPPEEGQTFVDDPLYGVTTTTVQEYCDEGCEYPLGSKVHNISNDLRTNNTDLIDDVAVIGFTSQQIDWTTEKGCKTTRDDFYNLSKQGNVNIKNAIELGNMYNKILHDSMYDSDYTNANINNIIASINTLHEKIINQEIIREDTHKDQNEYQNWIHLVKNIEIVLPENVVNHQTALWQNIYKYKPNIQFYQYNIQNLNIMKGLLQNTYFKNNFINSNYIFRSEQVDDKNKIYEVLPLQKETIQQYVQ